MLFNLRQAEDDTSHKGEWLWRLALTAIITVYIFCTLFHLVTLPTFEGPDEHRHYAYIRHIVNQRALPPITKPTNDAFSTYLPGQQSGQPPLYYTLVALLTASITDADDVEPFTVPNLWLSFYQISNFGYDNLNVFLRSPRDGLPFHGVTLAVRLGRLVSLVLGVFTLLGIYGIARALVPEQRGVAVLAVALAVSIPQFIFLHGVLTNDVAVILFSTLTLWIALRIAREGASLRLAIAGSVFASCAGLSKLNGAWVIGILWFMIIAKTWLNRGSIQAIFSTPLLTSIAIWLALTGWWYMRGLALYGDPFGVAIHAIPGQSPTAISEVAIREFGNRLRNGEESFWYNSGWSLYWRGFPWLTRICRIIFLGGLLGAIGNGVSTMLSSHQRQVTRSDQMNDTVAALQWSAVALCLVLATIGMLYWLLVYAWSLGRLMYPALAGIVVIVAIGWSWWLSQFRRWAANQTPWRVAAGLLGAVLLSTMIGGVISIHRDHSPHPDIQPLSDRVTRTQLTFLDPSDQQTPVASVVGFEILPQNVHAGEAMHARVCWLSQGFTRKSFPYSAQVVTEGDVRWGMRASFHGLGSYPMQLWQPHEIFCDPVSIRLSENVDRVRAYKLLVSMIDVEGSHIGASLPVVDGQGRPVFPVIGRVRVAPAHLMPVVTPTVSLGDFAAFVDAKIELQPANTLSVTLRWLATGSTPLDATVFFHVLDVNNQLIAQDDHQPDAGWFPTNYWQKSDVIVDQFTVKLPANTSLQELRCVTGMYDSSTLQRMTAIDLVNHQRFQDDIVPLHVVH